MLAAIIRIVLGTLRPSDPLTLTEQLAARAGAAAAEAGDPMRCPHADTHLARVWKKHYREAVAEMGRDASGW